MYGADVDGAKKINKTKKLKVKARNKSQKREIINEIKERESEIGPRGDAKGYPGPNNIGAPKKHNRTKYAFIF